MRIAEIRDSFGIDSLVVGERPDPEPGPGQVLLGMRAASLNYRDLLMVQGHYNPGQPLPLIPCSDGVGEVLAVGAGVTRVEVGDRVCPIFAQLWITGEPAREGVRSTLGGPLDGTLAERMVLHESGVVRVPEYLSDEEAATLPCAAVTAWSALTTPASINAGDTVLALGTGGVSIFALQLANLLGARVIVTSSSDEKLTQATERGAWQTINYRSEPDWQRRVKELTEGVGADRVIEVGGAETLDRSVSALRFGGQISLIGSLTGGQAKLNLFLVFMRGIRIQGILVGPREGFETMNATIEQHELRPAIDRVFAFDEVRAAFEYLAEARHFGKICIRF